MFYGLSNLAFIGAGGPEILVVMLVLLMMFGAKDAPRILRKWNEILNHIRNTADGFKREIMYGDLANDKPTYPPSSDDPDDAHGEAYDAGDYGYAEPDGPGAAGEDAPEDGSVEEPQKPKPGGEGGDAEKA